MLSAGHCMPPTRPFAAPLQAARQIPARHSRPSWGTARRSSFKAEERGRGKGGQGDPSPFFEPLLRSFLLGLGAAGIFESAHVASKFAALVGEVGAHQVSEVLPKVVDRFAPLFVGDHVVALGSWMLFYIIEAAAVYSVLNRYTDEVDAGRMTMSSLSTAAAVLAEGSGMLPHGCLGFHLSAAAVYFALNIYTDKLDAEKALRRMATLPKKMLPLRLQVFKQFLLRTNLLTPARKAAAVGAGVQMPTSSAFTGPPVQLAPPSRRSSPEFGGGSGPSSRKVVEEATNIVMAPPRVDSPVTKPLRPKEGVPLAQPVDAKTIDHRRQDKGLKPGELDPDANQLAHRMKELQGRRSYLRNFWYAGAISDQVKVGKPVSVELCGEKLVLFRKSDGKVACLNDICPHRGAPLSLGKVNTVNGHECVVCPYHGWAFDEGGVLRSVPAAEGIGEWPEKALVDHYPVEEKGGFVYIFWGSKSLPADERPPIPYVPELDDPTWRPVYGDIEFACNHWSVFENAIDMAHIHYLHSDSFGNEEAPQIRDMTCSHDAFGVKASFKLHNKPVNKLWEFSQVPIVEVTARALLPSTSVITFTLGAGLSFTTFVNTVPISEGRTVNRFALVRKLGADKLGIFNMALWDGMARKAMIKILSEDKAMVETLRPELLPREISVKADLPQIAYRKLRQEYVDMGYGVNPSSVKRKYQGDM